MVVLLPAAVSTLCTGFPSFLHCERGAYSSYFVVDVPEAADDCGKVYLHVSLLVIAELRTEFLLVVGR